MSGDQGIAVGARSVATERLLLLLVILLSRLDDEEIFSVLCALDQVYFQGAVFSALEQIRAERAA